MQWYVSGINGKRNPSWKRNVGPRLQALREDYGLSSCSCPNSCRHKIAFAFALLNGMLCVVCLQEALQRCS